MLLSTTNAFQLYASRIIPSGNGLLSGNLVLSSPEVIINHSVIVELCSVVGHRRTTFFAISPSGLAL